MEDPTRPVTTGAAPGEGRRPGVKSELASLRNRVREHDLIIEDMKRKEETSVTTAAVCLLSAQLSVIRSARAIPRSTSPPNLRFLQIETNR